MSSISPRVTDPGTTVSFVSYDKISKNGCYNGDLKNLVECGKNGGLETPLPESFKPLKMTKEMDDQWIELLRDNVIYPQEQNSL